MKKRLGFVSNSSSSSFVIVGWEIENISNERKVEILGAFGIFVKENLDEYRLGEYFRHGHKFFDCIDDDDVFYLGKLIAEGRDEGGEILEYTETDIATIVAEVEEIGKKIGMEKPKLYTGMVCD